MPALPKYVKAIPSANGTYLYFRYRNRYQRLPDDPASTEFHVAYATLLEGITKPSSKSAPSGSVAAMITEYKAAPEFQALAPKTQRDYARVLEHLQRAVGSFDAREIRRSDIIRLRNKIAAKRGNRTADLFVAVVSRCYGVGIDLGHAELNPAADIDRLAQSESYAPWPLAVRKAFESSKPPVHLMTGYMILLWTALRVGDAVRLGRQHRDGDGFRIRPSKTRRSLSGDRYVAIARPLDRYLAKLPKDHLTYITRSDGRPVRADTLSKEIRAWLADIGVSGYTVHGLRHTTATALAEEGASAHEIQAVMMHATLQMAERYTKRADQRRLAISAMKKLGGTKSERGKTRRGSGKSGSGKRA
ncbi:MAG: tyrosine-type recombinase/integrase [Hyphomicrobiaceae bacterium]